MFIASIFTLFLAQIVLSFTYNGTYVRELLSKGYRPEDEYSRAVLVAKGYIVRELLSKGYRPEDEYSRAVLVAKGYIAG